MKEQSDPNDYLDRLCDKIETEWKGEVLDRVSMSEVCTLTKKDASAETIVVRRPFVISTLDFPDKRLDSLVS